MKVKSLLARQRVGRELVKEGHTYTTLLNRQWVLVVFISKIQWVSLADHYSQSTYHPMKIDFYNLRDKDWVAFLVRSSTQENQRHRSPCQTSTQNGYFVWSGSEILPCRGRRVGNISEGRVWGETCGIGGSVCVCLAQPPKSQLYIYLIYLITFCWFKSVYSKFVRLLEILKPLNFEIV